MTRLEYYSAKIYALSGQPKLRGVGEKRGYNTFYNFARVELLYFLEQVSDLGGNKKPIRIARQLRKMMNDEEKAKELWVVCPISKKQAYVLGKFAIENDIRMLNYLQITNQEDEDEEYEDIFLNT